MKRLYPICLVAILALFAFSSPAWSTLVGDYGLSAGGATYTPITGTTLIANSGTTAATKTTGVAQEDAITTATSIGFNFTFSGTVYTQFRVTTSGMLVLGNPTTTTGSTAYRTNALNSLPVNAPVISAFWDWQSTWDGGSGSGCSPVPLVGVTYELQGKSPNRVLVIQWNTNLVDYQGYWSYGCGGTVWMYSYQVKLSEGSNKIQFHYGSMYSASNPLSTASVGIAASSSDFISLSFGSLSYSGTTANNSIDLYSTPIANGQYINFVPCGFTFTGLTGAGNGGTSTAANGDTFFQGFSAQKGNAATYTPLTIALPSDAACTSRSYSMTISGSSDYYFGTPGVQNVSSSLTNGASITPQITFKPSAIGTRTAVLTFTDQVSGTSRS
jgi:hypothetical protein